MKKVVFLVFIFFFSCKSKLIESKEKINILFIGNSLTYYHDMPLTLQKMLDEKGLNYNIEQSTFPGMSLDGHLEEIITKKEDDNIYTRTKTEGEITETEKKLSSKKWDIIILQERTYTLYFTEVVKEILPLKIETIKTLNSNKNCKYIFFNTWISKNEEYPIESICRTKHSFDWKKYYINEDVSNKEKFCSVKIENEIENLKYLNQSLNSIKLEHNLTITNHPNVHYNVRKSYPEIELYDDNYHPSEAGSFLNACVFYSLLTNTKSSKLKFTGKLDKKTAAILKTAAN